jgi:hypothetical protein
MAFFGVARLCAAGHVVLIGGGEHLRTAAP